jgi:hypothetical protein
MGIKLGDISPFAGAMTGRGLFGKGLAKLADSGAGFLVPASYIAQGQRNKNDRRTAATAAEAAAIKKAEFDAKRRGAAGPTMKKGGKVSAAEAVHKHERAKHKGQPLTKMAKGGSASKRGDGCCSKGKTKGKMV